MQVNQKDLEFEVVTVEFEKRRKTQDSTNIKKGDPSKHAETPDMNIIDSQMDILAASDNVSLSKQFGQYRDSQMDNASANNQKNGQQPFVREFTPKSQMIEKPGKKGPKTEKKSSIDI